MNKAPIKNIDLKKFLRSFVNTAPLVVFTKRLMIILQLFLREDYLNQTSLP
jgi:hypothetical protein